MTLIIELSAFRNITFIPKTTCVMSYTWEALAIANPPPRRIITPHGILSVAAFQDIRGSNFSLGPAVKIHLMLIKSNDFACCNYLSREPHVMQCYSGGTMYYQSKPLNNSFPTQALPLFGIHFFIKIEITEVFQKRK